MTKLKTDLKSLGPMVTLHVFQPMLPQLSFIMTKVDSDAVHECDAEAVKNSKPDYIDITVYNILGLSSSIRIPCGCGAILIETDMDVEQELREAENKANPPPAREPSILTASSMPVMQQHKKKGN